MSAERALAVMMRDAIDFAQGVARRGQDGTEGKPLYLLFHEMERRLSELKQRPELAAILNASIPEFLLNAAPAAKKKG